LSGACYNNRLKQARHRQFGVEAHSLPGHPGLNDQRATRKISETPRLDIQGLHPSLQTPHLIGSPASPSNRSLGCLIRGAQHQAQQLCCTGHSQGYETIVLPAAFAVLWTQAYSASAETSILSYTPCLLFEDAAPQGRAGPRDPSGASLGAAKVRIWPRYAIAF